MNTEIFAIALKDAIIHNIPLLIIICVLIVALLYLIVGTVLTVFKRLYNYLRNAESI